MPPFPDERCPSVAHVLERRDGGLVRIRVPGGVVPAGALVVVADLAGRHGSGIVEITNRANLQLRGITNDASDELVDELSAVGLSDGAAGDLRRNVLAAPLAGLGSLAAAVHAALRAEPALDGLSPKWGVTLDAGGPWSLAGRRDDVVVTAGAGGTWTVHDAAGAAVAATDGDGAGLVAASAIAGLDGPRRQVTVPGTPAAAAPLGAGDGWVGAMPWLGRLDPGAARSVAATAVAHGDGTVVLTPWRGVVLPGVAGVPGATAAGSALDRLADAGLVTDPADPRSGVVACTGAAGCTSGLTDAPADAAAVAAAVAAAFSAPVGAFVGAPAGAARSTLVTSGKLDHTWCGPVSPTSRPGPVAVHVSGCPKRCAHSAPAPVTLLATAAGRYDVLDHTDRRVAEDLDPAAAVALAATLTAAGLRA